MTPIRHRNLAPAPASVTATALPGPQAGFGGKLAWRLKQEAANLWLWGTGRWAAGGMPAPGCLEGLPDPAPVVEWLRGAPYARELEGLAEQILAHRFPVFGGALETGPDIEWRRDYISGKTSPKTYCRIIPYLDFDKVGDHKIVWELNRHQHLILLAQAFRLSGRREFLEEIWAQLDSWLRDNPFLRGINWASALEAGFRSLSWIWVWHLASPWMPEPLRARFLAGLQQHGRFLERNLSVYFSPNTHLLGEAVALHALGKLIPALAASRRWEHTGAALVARQMETQVREDGSHFERSSYYQVYALDMFLFHQAIAETSPAYREKLSRMAAYLAALQGPSRSLPMLGDDDGGRWFHPYGKRHRFGRATLATCAVLLGEGEWAWEPDDLHEQALWWLGARALARRPAGRAATPSRLFEPAGVAVLAAGEVHLVVQAGPFGAGSGGHSHSDTLSLVARDGGEEVLIDSGTYTYVADRQQREAFRGSAAHNTLQINGRDQALPAGPFRWIQKPEVEVLDWVSTPELDYLDAVCRYAGFAHRRRLALWKHLPLALIYDAVDGPCQQHRLEQFWHLGRPPAALAEGCFQVGARTRLVFPAGQNPEVFDGREPGWSSPVFGEKRPAPVLRLARLSTLPARFWAALDFRGEATRIEVDDSSCAIACRGRSLRARFNRFGAPDWEWRDDPEQAR